MEKNNFKLGIIGCPLSHSISPVIQTAALNSCNFNGSYEKFEVSAENLEAKLNFFKKNNFKGFNITIPYKIEMLNYLDFVSPEVKKIGAVNTVKIAPNGNFEGYNTDISGFIQAIPKEHHKIKSAKILGCGGAALAVVFGLIELGAEDITICARDLNKANKFVQSLQDKVDMTFKIENINDIKSLCDTDILINATPLGTKGDNEKFSPIKEETLKTAKKETLVYDLVYNPQQTLLIKTARDIGIQTINGLDMLILQGAKSFEIWTGTKPSIEKMKTAALKTLQ